LNTKTCFDSSVGYYFVDDCVLLIKKIKDLESTGIMLDPLEEEAVQRSEFEDRLTFMSLA